MVAAGRCWCLLVVNSSIMVHLAQASSLDVLVPVGEVRMHAGLHTTCILLHGALVCLVFGVSQQVTYLENGLLEIFRLVCGSSGFLVGAGSELPGVSGAGRRAGRPLRAAWPSGCACDISASQLACT